MTTSADQHHSSSSTNGVKSTPHKHTLKEYSPTFQFKAMIELAETIARHEVETGVSRSKDVDYLISLCPALPTGKQKSTNGIDELASDDLVTDYTEYINQPKESNYLLLSETRQVAALALGYYLVVSKGSNADRILPSLLSICRQLANCKWHNRAKVTPDFFARHLISLLRDVAVVIPSWNNEICDAIVNGCLIDCHSIMRAHQQKFLYESKNTARVLYGVFKGLSEGLLEFQDNHIRVIMDVIQNFNVTIWSITTKEKDADSNQELKAFKSRLLKSMMVFAIKILYRISVVNKGVTDQDYENFYNIAMKTPSPAYIQRTLSGKKNAGPAVKLFIHSVELATQVAVLKKPHRHDTLAAFNAILHSVVRTTQDSQQSDEEKMYESVIKGLQVLSIADPLVTTQGVKVLREFAETVLEKSDKMKTMPVNALCAILKHDYENHELTNISPVVYAISNSIYMEKDSDKNNSRIIVLGELAVQINQQPVTDLIRPVLISQFTKKKQEGKIDAITTGQLAKIAHLLDEKSFEEVVDTIYGIHSNPLHSPDTSMGEVLTNSIYIILDNLTDNVKFQTTLLIRTMKLFTKIAAEIQADNVNKTRQREFAQHIGILLPVLAKQLKNLNFDPIDNNPNAQTLQIHTLFRTVWYYCLLFDFFNYKEKWEWVYTDACEDIAKYAPVLTGTARSFRYIEKEINFLIDKSRLASPIGEYHNQLYNLIANTTNQSDLTTILQTTVKRFDFAQTLYLLAIFYLETKRAKSGTFRYSLHYLADHGLTENQEFFKCLIAVTERAFMKWKEFVTSKESETVGNPTEMVETELIFLFKSYCSRSEAVRKCSMVFISIMTKSFTHVFWSFRCIRTLLDLLSALYECADTGKTTELVSIQIPVENSDQVETLYLPENYSARQKMLEKFHKLALDWIKVALTLFPNVVKSHLEGYLLKFSKSFNGNLQHIGYSLAVYMTMPAEYLRTMNVVNTQQLVKDKRKGLSTLNENRFYSSTQSIAVHSYHNGEIDALRKIANLEGKTLEQLLVGTLSDCLKNKNALDLNKFNHYMQLATAYIISEAKLMVTLLQWIVWTPVFILSKDSLTTAVFCWKWLASSRPEFELYLLAEISHGWSWTITQKLGIFSGNSANEGAIELAVDEGVSHRVQDDTKPHRIWINFLAERFQVINSIEKDMIDIYAKMVMKAFEDVSVLSKDHNSLGTRFRLCLLGLIVAKQAEIIEEFPVSLLRDRIFSAILNWFTLHPTWYDPGSMSQVEEDLKVLKELNRKLAQEKAPATVASARSPLFDTSSDTQSTASARRGAFIATSPSVSNMSSATPRAPRSVTGTVKTSASGYSSRASNLINLILLLTSHEIERMIIWHDPQNADEAIAQSNADNSIVTQKVIDPKTWKNYVETAWGFSPRLALRLVIRFPMDLIRSELQRYVRENAADLVDIPEAVSYLVTPYTVENNVEELKYLLNWSPATLSIALTFLNVPYVKSPLVAQYAIRTLRKFSPEAVVFYLPQLVQCLRHDNRGNLKRYLISMSSRSVMFAHQLIWTLRTEIIPADYEEMEKIRPAELEISAISVNLNKEVMGVLDSRQKALYEEEFGFFDKLNEISGALIPVEKELRTGKLQEAMQQITTSKNLYPPTDTKYHIEGFDNRGCITLKSAKKVPILVPFYVKERPPGLDIGQDPSNKDKEEYEHNETRKLMLIFKMGDDCRQDQLALQIISMFKQIFKRLDLPLYLYPYRVITTGRDMGIIECVPNSKSRHDLGGYTEGDLYDYFINKYGHENTIEFQRARKNFIESMAAYSVVSFILNIKDRHNGNLLVDEDGHLIHIDFGFIFDIAPGGNYGIEVRVPFKLTYEMLLLMGEDLNKDKPKFQQPNQSVSLSIDPANSATVVFDEGVKSEAHAEPFNLFVDLVIRGYLASRDHMDSIVAIVEVMLQSELPCFKQDAIKNLKARFCADKPEKEAVRFIREKVTASYQNMWSFLYDKYQQKVEGVNM